MDRFSYFSFTDKQKNYFDKYIWNGVGSREFFINPHDLIFKEASKHHDAEYFIGGTEEDRILADKAFLHQMHQAVRRQSKWKRPFYYLAASIYSIFLKKLGKFAFEYTERRAETFEEMLKHYHNYLERTGKPKPPPFY
jgi:hypothetical protein